MITEEDRRAAAAVTASGSGHRYEIQLGHLCNNRCVFCSSGQLTAMKIARTVPVEPILEALEDARAAGATHLTFLGGEPTIHKRFREALSKAVDLGFEHIVIFTNGVMFPQPGFIESITSMGNFEWRISIQGATEEAHVATTERPESFQRIVHGLGELQRRGQLVTTNMCVNERSYRSLPHYPELLKKYGVRQLHVDIVRPESTGERNEDYLREIMPRYSDMAPYYSAMLDGFDAWDPDFDVNVGNLPYCILPEWGSRIHHGGQETVTKSSDGEGLEDEMNKYEWQASLRRHLPTCDDCVFRTRCTGIFRVYLDLHGEDEFRGLSREEVLSRDTQHRNFVLFAETWLAPLRQALATNGAADGWRMQQEISEDRRRQVEISFAHGASGGQVRLCFQRRGHAATPVLRSSCYDTSIEVDATAPRKAVADLLTWVAETLAGDTATAPTLDEAAVAQLFDSPLLNRGRRRVAALSQQMKTRFSAPGWHLEPLHWPSSTAGEVIARGPGERHIGVRFTLSTRSGRSHVGVGFRMSDDGDGDVRSAVDHLARALRRDSETASA